MGFDLKSDRPLEEVLDDTLQQTFGSDLVALQMPQGWELIIILALVFLLFGAKKMPDAARGIGKSLRILKTETKGLRDEDDDASPSVTEASNDQLAASGGPAPTSTQDAVDPTPAADIRDHKESAQPKTAGKE